MIDVQATENNLRSKKPLKFRRFGKKGQDFRISLRSNIFKTGINYQTCPCKRLKLNLCISIAVGKFSQQIKLLCLSTVFSQFAMVS